MEKSLTVIIPTYNSEFFLEEAIKSVENQSLNDFEIIVVDDGSTDNTKYLVDRLKKSYKNITYVYNENKGVSSARNLGIKLSKTRYISFLDADDIYERNFVEKMLGKIKKTDADLVACSYYIFSPDRKIKENTMFIEENFLLNYIIGINKINTSNFIIDRRFLEKNNLIFDENLSWNENFDFFVRSINRAEKTSLVGEYLTSYRFDFDNKTLSEFSWDKLQKDKKIILNLLANKDLDFDEIQKDALLNYKLPELLSDSFYKAIKLAYKKEEIRKYFRKYKKYMDKISLKYGIRSIKLYIKIKFLKIRLR